MENRYQLDIYIPKTIQKVQLNFYLYSRFITMITQLRKQEIELLREPIKKNKLKKKNNSRAFSFILSRDSQMEYINKIPAASVRKISFVDPEKKFFMRRKSCCCQECGKNTKKVQFISEILPFFEPAYSKKIQYLQQRKNMFQNKKMKMSTQKNIFLKPSIIIYIIQIFNIEKLSSPLLKYQENNDKEKQEDEKIKTENNKEEAKVTFQLIMKNYQSPNENEEKKDEIKENIKKLENCEKQNEENTMVFTRQYLRQTTNINQQKNRLSNVAKTRNKRKPKTFFQPEQRVVSGKNIQLKPLPQSLNDKLKLIIEKKIVRKIKRDSFDDFKMISSLQKSRLLQLWQERREKTMEKRAALKKKSWNTKEVPVRVLALFASNIQQLKRRASIQIADNKQEDSQKIQKNNPLITTTGFEELLSEEDESNISEEISFREEEKKKKIQEQKNNKNQKEEYKKILGNSKKTLKSLIQQQSLEGNKVIRQFIKKNNLFMISKSQTINIIKSEDKKVKPVKNDIEKIYGKQKQYSLHVKSQSSKLQVQLPILKLTSARKSFSTYCSPYMKKSQVN